MMTGRGGWPMSVFLTPDLKPFFGGTYFPPRTSSWTLTGQIAAGLPRAARTRWPARPAQLAEHDHRRPRDRSATGAGRCEAVLRRPWTGAARELRRRHTAASGRPQKFPTPLTLALPAAPLPQHRRRADLRRMVRHTLRGHGRAAASTTTSAAASTATPSTRDWIVPHFEKMLYDNAQLASLLPGGRRGLRRRDAYAAIGRDVAGLPAARHDATPRAASTPASTPTAAARRAPSTSGRRAEITAVVGAQPTARVLAACWA